MLSKEWDDRKEKIQPPFPNSARANAKVARTMAIVGEVVESLRPHFNQINVDQVKHVIEQKINGEFKDKLTKESPDILKPLMESGASDETCFSSMLIK